MPLYPGPMRHGVHNVIQEILLRIAFVVQDVGEWLLEHGRSFEDWVAPSGRRAIKPPTDEYWRKP